MGSIIGQPERFTPAWRASDAGKAPVYHLRPGTVFERETIEAELAGEYRAGRVFDFELQQTATEGVATLLADDPAGRDEILALVAADAAGETIDRREAQKLREVKEVLEQHWPEYRALIAQLQRRNAMLPLVCFRRFCTGWDNVDATFVKGIDGMVSVAALAEVPPFELKAAGRRAYDMLYAGHLAGNSAAPSKSDDGRQTSNSDGGSARAGSSRGKRTPKIPGSPRPRRS